MGKFKTKSLVNSVTDEQLKHKGGCTTQFISFESAIEMFRKAYNLDNSDYKLYSTT